VFEGTARRPIEPSTPLGSSNAAIFGEWLGHSAEELAAYRANGVIGPAEKEASDKKAQSTKSLSPAKSEALIGDGI
jgi:formyl-CoA transferase